MHCLCCCLESACAFQKHVDSDSAYAELARTQALTLLATLLMDTFTGHEALLFKYIKSANNLMAIMNLLRAKSRSIQFEAFHVFKVFVANPHKPELITGILVSNKEKLLRFLKNFLQERGARPSTAQAGHCMALDGGADVWVHWSQHCAHSRTQRIQRYWLAVHKLD